MFDLNEAPSSSSLLLPHYPADFASRISPQEEGQYLQHLQAPYFLSQNASRDAEASELALSSFTIEDDRCPSSPQTDVPLSFSDVSSSPHNDSDYKFAGPDGLESEISVVASELPQCGNDAALIRGKGKAAEAQDATCSLSLGNAFHCSRKRSESEENETKQLMFMPPVKVRKPDVFGLELGRPSMDALSKQFTTGSLFWDGEIQFQGWPALRVAAHSLGLLKSDSKLRKLPNIMSVNGFVPLKEISHILSMGFREPIIKFVPFGDFSLEDAESFQSMVQTLLEGSHIRMKDSHQLELGLGHQNSTFRSSLASYAAVVYLDDFAGGMSQAVLYLVAPASCQDILRIWSPNISICAVEEVDICDHSSVYGILLFDAMNHISLENRNLKKNKLNYNYVERSTSPISLAENNTRKCFPKPHFTLEMENRDTFKMKATFCSQNTSHFEEVELAEESSLIREPSHLKCAPSVSCWDGLQGDIGSDGKEEADCSYGEAKKHFKESTYSESISEEENNKELHGLGKERDRDGWSSRNDKDYTKSTERKYQHSEISREHRIYCWGKDSNRGSEKNRDTEHLYLHHDNERSWKNRERTKDFDREKTWNRDSGMDNGKRGEELEKLLKAEENKSEVEKASANITENVESCHGILSLQGDWMGKERKKREREDHDDNYCCMRSSKETKMSFENAPESVLQDRKFVIDFITEAAKDSNVRRVDEIVSPESCFKDIIEEVSSALKSDDVLFLAKEKDRVENIGQDNKTLTHLINDGNGVDDQSYDDADKNNIEKLHIQLPSERIGTSYLVSKTNSAPMYEDGESTELPVFRADISGLLPLAKIKDDKVFCELLLEKVHRETRSWLASKESMLYFQEEFGVLLTILGERHNSDCSPKSDHRQSSLHVRITMMISDTCDVAEACWFVNQAADIVRVISARDVFSKCLWYEGPVQIDDSGNAPSIDAVVKKVKGEDRINLELIQEDTGVMIDVILNKDITAQAHKPDAKRRFIGLQLKCVRRKELLEASKQAEALLSSIADVFSKEFTAEIGVSPEVDLYRSETDVNENLSSSQALTVTVQGLLGSSPTKLEDSLLGKQNLSAGENIPAFAMSEESPCKISEAACACFNEQSDIGLSIGLEGASSKALIVSNLPEKITAPEIRDLFESILNEKLGPGLGRNPVVACRYLPENNSALIELANDTLLNEALKLYAEDKSVFSGFELELGLSVSSKLSRKSSSVHSEFGCKGFNPDGNLEESQYKKEDQKKNTENYSRRRLTTVSSSESGSEYMNERYVDEHDARFRKAHLFEKPKPLFLTELMRNASAQTIKHLFEEIITKYISPSLVSSSGRQLVLDVRYVPSRGCAFVDLATPELVKFMLELHSQRPEVFCNMKMELGRRQVPHSLDDDPDRRLLHSTSSRYRSRGHVSGGSYSYCDRQRDRRDLDYFDESDKGRDLSRQSSFARRWRSDPERTVYADRLPECATESMIRKIFERALSGYLTEEQWDAFGNDIITEVRYVPTKFCAFIVFCAEELTRIVLHMYSKDEDVFDKMRLKPHFHSRMEDLYRDDIQERDDDAITTLPRERILDHRGSHHEHDDHLKAQHEELFNGRSRNAAHRALSASSFKEVDRRRSVYVDRIPEDLSEAALRETFEKVYRHKGHGRDMISQVTFFRDKYDPKKLCAFVEVRNEDATHDLIECYNANEATFLGMRIRPGLKYNS